MPLLTKIRPLDEVARCCAARRSAGRKIVLANGCFDLLHSGHVLLLQQARALGDTLVVAVNSDVSIRALKGPDRPLNRQEDRCRVLAALECVDLVTIFEDRRATRVIEMLQPHVLAKGDDVSLETLPAEEKAALAACGAQAVFLTGIPGLSTTHLIDRARNGA